MNNDDIKITSDPEKQIQEMDAFIEEIKKERESFQKEADDILAKFNAEFSEFAKRWEVFDKKIEPFVNQGIKELFLLEKHHIKKTNADLVELEKQEKIDEE